MAFRFCGGRVAHISLWSGLAAASLAITAPKIHRGAVAYSLHPTGPLHSSDSFLNFAAGASGASEKLIALFQSLTASKTVVILIHKDDPRSSILGMTTAYLASPHPVRIVQIDDANPSKELSTTNPAALAAVVFCRVSRPAWIAPGKIFGSGLEVVSLPDSANR